MNKLLVLVVLGLALVVGLGQTAFQRTMLTTNTVPAGVNGQVLVLVSGVPRWSTNAGSLTLSNVTILGTLTVSTQIVINGTGPGTIQLYATNGTSIVTISSADSFSSYTLYLPTAIQTNSVLQSTADGHLYWSTDPVLNSVEVTGSGAGYLLIGDASTTNTFKLVGPAAFGSSFTNLWPTSPGTVGQVLTMGTNGQWYFAAPSSVVPTFSVNATNVVTPNFSDSSTVAYSVSGSNVTATASGWPLVSVNSTNVPVQANLLDTATVTWGYDGNSNLTATAVNRVETLSTLTWASTTIVDVSATNANYRTLTLGGDTTLSSTNRAAGHWSTLLISGAATNCALAWPAWIPMNAALPASLTANKHMSVTVFFTDTTDAGAFVNVATQP